MTPKSRFTIYQHLGRGSSRGAFSRSPKRKRPPLKIKKILSYVGVIALAMFLAGSIGVVGLFAWVSRDLPDPNTINSRNVALTTKIYDRTGEHILYEVHGDQKRTIVELENVSPYARNATVAIEDKSFYHHKGFDLRGILRALYTNIKSGDLVGQGGSTITQQFIKNSILTKKKSPIRKIKEVILAVEMERRFTKDQILKLYLNEIPYGSLAYGIESASQTFFAKPAKDLTLPEAAMLAALPQAPSRYSPHGSHTDELVGRTNHVLDAMAEQGYITKDEAAAAKQESALDHVQARRETINAPHFVFYVKDELAALYGDAEVEGGGLKVITTLDFDKQKMAEEAIAAARENNKKKWNANTAAMMAMDPKTGEVVAMVGSVDYFSDEINGKFNALLGKLQPGSSIKPMVYAAAFEKGYTPGTVLNDVTTTFKNYPKDYTPNNYDFKERGPVTAKEALAGSLNIPAVQMLYLTGIDRFLVFAERMGYTTFDRSKVGLSLTLGGGEVRAIEHFAAFSAFAQDGVLAPTTAILRVEDRNGTVLLDNEKDRPAAKRIIDKEVARQVNGILSDNAARAYIFGAKNHLTLGERPVAAKTGTTNDNNDAWTVGYTPSLVTGVWVGNDTGAEMKKGADGSIVAAPIWNAFMRKALDGTPIDSFPAAAPVTTGKPVLDGDKSARVKVRVDRVSEKLATETTPEEFVEERAYGIPHSILFFVDKDDPRGAQPAHPESDPQFANWEKAVAVWAEKQGIVGSAPPTEYDDVHVPENKPTVAFFRPTDAETISNRSMFVEMSAQARRGIYRIEYSIDGDYIGMLTTFPYGGFLTIPNRIGKGFHTLTAKAFDDVGNNASASVTINLTADPGPIDVQWITPWNFQSISLSQAFPFTITFRIDDVKSISKVLVVARSVADGTTTLVGEIKNPILPNFALEWSKATLGRNILSVEATLFGGETRTVETNVDIVQ